jgi:hypothetical protein
MSARKSPGADGRVLDWSNEEIAGEILLRMPGCASEANEKLAVIALEETERLANRLGRVDPDSVALAAVDRCRAQGVRLDAGALGFLRDFYDWHTTFLVGRTNLCTVAPKDRRAAFDLWRAQPPHPTKRPETAISAP